MAAGSAQAPKGGTWGPHLTLAILIGVAGYLAYVRFAVIPGQATREVPEFHFENPLLRASPGDCVRLRVSQEANEYCLVAESRALRPASGPDVYGGMMDLKRAAPYLMVRSETVGTGGGGCATGGGLPNFLRYDLNKFGMVSDASCVIERVVPMWITIAGRERFVYQVILQRFDQDYRYICYLGNDAPVIGVIKQEMYSRDPNRDPIQWWYREVADCPRGAGG